MLMFVDPPPHLTPLSVPVPKVADMTRHTPPHISACVQTCHRAGYHGNYCFYQRLRLMLREGGTWLGGNTVNRRMEEDMVLVFVFVCPIIPALFIWDDFDSHNVCSQDSQPRCDHREMKRGFLLTFTLTTSPSDSIFFLPHHEFLLSVSLPLHLLLPPPCARLWCRSSGCRRQIHPCCLVSVIPACRPGKKAVRDKTDGEKSIVRRGWGVKKYRKSWWKRQTMVGAGQSQCVCVCVCVGMYRQLIPTGNAAAVLLGQCAIVSFFIITACSSSCALPLHPSHAFM